MATIGAPGWGISVMTVLPGGVEVMVSQARHPVAAALDRMTP